MHQCLIPGCPNNAPYYLGVRLRRPRKKGRRSSGTAIWAPNCNAYLCDQHAREGYSINVTLTPLATRDITTNTSAGGALVTRTTPITQTP